MFLLLLHGSFSQTDVDKTFLKDVTMVEKQLSELLSMSGSDIMVYFTENNLSKNQVNNILNDLGFPPKNMSTKSLYKYAARQISETGLFQRISKQ